MIRSTTRVVCSLVLVGSLLGCAAKRPVLYPNAQLTAVGPEIAQADIEDCLALARSAGVEADRTGQVAQDTAQGAVTGAAVGTGVGAVAGDVGRGAGAGAAGGAAGGMARGMFREKPDPIFRRFVEQCLRDKGYQVVGWK